MLAGRMSNQEEDEVEEELEALHKQVNGIKDEEVLEQDLPSVPTQSLPSPKESQKERWERRALEQQEALLA
jgi:charged multivesicular body protein 6